MATVLLVDDEEKILATLVRSLRREGYRLLTAETPREALALLEREAIDLIMSDHKMPGMSGIELLHHASLVQPHAARILITGWSYELPDEDDEQRLIYAVIPKPWEDAELKGTIRMALARSSTGAHLPISG